MWTTMPAGSTSAADWQPEPSRKHVSVSSCSATMTRCGKNGPAGTAGSPNAEQMRRERE